MHAVFGVHINFEYIFNKETKIAMDVIKNISLYRCGKIFVAQWLTY